MWTINPTPSATPFPEPRLDQLLEQERRRVTWYAPKTALPSVAPAEPTPNPSPAQAPRYQSNQDVVADNPNPLSDRQMILGEAPEIPIQQDLEIPNMVSWEAPKVERPRYQPTAPKLIAPPVPRKIEERAPEVAAAPTQFSIEQLDNLPVLRFRREQKAAPKPQQRRVEAPAAPRIDPQATQTADASQFQATARLRYQSRNEQTKAAPQNRTLDASGAPILRDAPGTPGLAPLPVQDDVPRLRYQSGDSGRPQPETPRQRALAELAETAPQVPTEIVSAAGPIPGQDAPRLRYQNYEQNELGTPQQRSLAEVGGPAPQVEADLAANAVGTLPGQDAPRLRYQDRNQGSPANTPRSRALAEVAGDAAPAVDGPVGETGANAAVASLNKTVDLPGAPPVSLGEASGDASGGTGGDRNLVVVGVDPADKPPAEMPRGSRPARFAAGPNAEPDGGQTATEEQTAALRAPNLAIRGAPAPTTGPAPRPQRGDPGNDLRRLTRTGGFRDLTGAPPPTDFSVDAPKIDLDRPFVGRPVYTVAINMPNVTSYRGDWVIQFAEWLPPAEARKRQRESAADIEKRLAVKDETLTPPWPHKKVDPKYVAEAVREGVEGEVTLYGVIGEDGALRDVQVLRGVDARLDQAAQSALAQWVFEPARKDGKTVVVEVLVRIPFRLNPNVKVRY